MQTHNIKTIFPSCPNCKSTAFELRVMKDEEVAATRCINCSSNYLLLDSEDYWFDVIQNGYPLLRRCSCKNKTFRLRIDYTLYDDEDGGIEWIQVYSTCANCEKTRRQLDYKVARTGVDHLISDPLVPCKNPKILYDLKQLNLCVALSDILHIVNYFGNKANFEFYCCVREGGNWINILQDVTQTKAIIEKNNYLFIYAMPKQTKVSEDQVDTLKKEAIFWKRSEVIRFGSIRHINTWGEDGKNICYSSHPPTNTRDIELGLFFYIDFSNEFVDDEEITPKSKDFCNVSDGLMTMLKNEFVSWRGRNCFDNPEINVRVFGDRFQKKSIK